MRQCGPRRAASNQSINIQKVGNPLDSTPQSTAAAAKQEKKKSRFEADREDDQGDKGGGGAGQEGEQQRKFAIQSEFWTQVEQPQEVKATSWVKCGSSQQGNLRAPEIPQIQHPPAIKRQEPNRPPSYPMNPRTMVISMQPPIDTSGRRGGISLPQGYSTARSLTKSIPAGGAAQLPDNLKAKYVLPPPPPFRVGSAHRLNNGIAACLQNSARIRIRR